MQKGTFPSTPTHLGWGPQHPLAASAPEQDNAWDPDLRSEGRGDRSGGRGLSRLVLVSRGDRSEPWAPSLSSQGLGVSHSLGRSALLLLIGFWERWLETGSLALH